MQGTKTMDPMENPLPWLKVEISPPSANVRLTAPMQRVAVDNHQHFCGSFSSSQFADSSYTRQFADGFEDRKNKQCTPYKELTACAKTWWDP